MKIKRLYAVMGMLVAAGGLAFSSVAPARATSPGVVQGCEGQGTIVNGLWTGVNMATGMSGGCGASSSATTDTQMDTTQASVVAPHTGTGRYVALGDSVAAGVGLPTVPGSDPACGVSNQAYATLVAANTGLPYQNLACSGATVGNLFTEQHLSGTNRDIEPQLTRAFAGGTPSLITITAGANDIYWQYFIQQCSVRTCGTNADQVTARGLIRAMQAKLNYALYYIWAHSEGHSPQVILTGYYRPFSTACAQQQTALTATELAWLNGQNDALNQAIARTTAHYSFARFAPVDFTGHELCTADSWIQGPSDFAPFHPTVAGQQVMAQAVLDTYYQQ
jgi:lysophospholipase L1-like esterase